MSSIIAGNNKGICVHSYASTSGKMYQVSWAWDKAVVFDDKDNAMAFYHLLHTAKKL